MDKWSRYQHRRLWDSETLAVHGDIALVSDLAIWDAGTTLDDHPEFAANLDTYVETARTRIGCVAASVPKGTPIVITVRHRMGVVDAIHHAAKQVGLRDDSDLRAVVSEVGGAKHIGDGTPLDALDLSVWRSR